MKEQKPTEEWTWQIGTHKLQDCHEMGGRDKHKNIKNKKR
jgi:hypothetical protein